MKYLLSALAFALSLTAAAAQTAGPPSGPLPPGVVANSLGIPGGALGTGVANAMANAVNTTNGLGVVGTSGATVPLNNANNTESGTWTFSSDILEGVTTGSYVDFGPSVFTSYEPNSSGVVKSAVYLNYGFASNTAGNEMGDLDLAFALNGHPPSYSYPAGIVAFNTTPATGPAFTPALGSTWTLGAPGQTWKFLYVDNIQLTGAIEALTTSGVTIKDYNNAPVANFSSIGTAVNYLTLLARATGVAPGIQSTCSDTNCDFTISAQGTGNVVLYNPSVIWGTMLPKNDNVYNLGSATQRFQSIFATTFYSGTGLIGVTGTTCTQWTGGICTHL